MENEKKSTEQAHSKQVYFQSTHQTKLSQYYPPLNSTNGEKPPSSDIGGENLFLKYFFKVLGVVMYPIYWVTKAIVYKAGFDKSLEDDWIDRNRSILTYENNEILNKLEKELRAKLDQELQINKRRYDESLFAIRADIARVEQFKATIRILEKREQSLKESREEALNTIETLRSEIKALNENDTTLTSVVKEKERRIRELETVIEKDHNQVRALEDTIRKEQQDKKHLSEQFTRERQELKNKITETISDAERRMQEHTDRVDEFVKRKVNERFSSMFSGKVEGYNAGRKYERKKRVKAIEERETQSVHGALKVELAEIAIQTKGFVYDAKEKLFEAKEKEWNAVTMVRDLREAVMQMFHDLNTQTKELGHRITIETLTIRSDVKEMFSAIREYVVGEFYKVNNSLEVGLVKLGAKIEQETIRLDGKLTAVDTKIGTEMEKIDFKVQIKMGDLRADFTHEIARMDKQQLSLVNAIEKKFSQYAEEINKFRWDIQQLVIQGQNSQMESREMMRKAERIYEKHTNETARVRIELDDCLNKLKHTEKDMAAIVVREKSEIEKIAMNAYVAVQNVAMAKMDAKNYFSEQEHQDENRQHKIQMLIVGLENKRRELDDARIADEDYAVIQDLKREVKWLERQVEDTRFMDREDKKLIKKLENRVPDWRKKVAAM